MSQCRCCGYLTRKWPCQEWHSVNQREALRFRDSSSRRTLSTAQVGALRPFQGHSGEEELLEPPSGFSLTEHESPSFHYSDRLSPQALVLTSRGGLFRYPTQSASCKTQARYDSASPPLRPPIASHTWNSSLSPDDQMLRTVSSASSLIRSPALSVNAMSPTSREASRQAQREREQKERAASRQGRSEHRTRVPAGTHASSACPRAAGRCRRRARPTHGLAMNPSTPDMSMS